MIVTRTRKKRFQLGRLLAPLIVVAIIAAAFVWPVSRARLHAVPQIGAAMDAAAAAFGMASLRQSVGQRDRTIADLQRQIATLQSEVQSRDSQISALTTQTNRQDEQLARAPQAVRSTSVAPGVGGASPAPGADAQQVTRTAKVWDQMDPEAAAKIAQRLPDGYVVQVLAEMDPDQVAEILGALPPKVAARLVSERANPVPSSAHP